MKESFWNFFKWYYRYTTNIYFNFTNSNSPTMIRKKDRLSFIMFAYIFLVPTTAILLIPFNIKYLLFIIEILITICSLCAARFSFIYYFILYSKYKKRNNSLNDNVIYQICILLELDNNLRRIISKFYRIVDVRGNIFGVKIYLKQRKTKNTKFIILKIKSNKILFDGKLLCNKVFEQSEFVKLFSKYKI